ncbi:MAG: hypothetical protein M3N13_09085, partial [Candidatus Eremiobacteraeota bacterium]|nr:hypothetical protein [Candidatus Eremiobacteraeota bacterium]
VEALIVPSARHAGAMNMSIIVDRLRHASKIEIDPSTGFAAGNSIVIYGKYSEGRPQSKSDGPGLDS